ncbi:MAG: hypothetical protein AABY93_09760 [Bacteroidota bacterium]
MKSNKVFKIAAIIFGVFAVISIGKGIMCFKWSHLTVEEKATKITERMSSKLDLTAEQKEKVLALNLEKVKAFDDKNFWKNDHKHGPHGKSGPLYENWWKEMKEILNDEQEKKLKL